MQSLPFFGPYGSSALPFIERFAAHGANAFWFHGFDATAIEACAHHAIAACVEFKTFRADFAGLAKGRYRLLLTAYNPDTDNAGVAEQEIVVP